MLPSAVLILFRSYRPWWSPVAINKNGLCVNRMWLLLHFRTKNVYTVLAVVLHMVFFTLSLQTVSPDPTIFSIISPPSYHPRRVKALICFLWETWSQLTITFQTAALAASQGWVTHSEESATRPFPHAWASRRPRLASLFRVWFFFFLVLGQNRNLQQVLETVCK